MPFVDPETVLKDREGKEVLARDLTSSRPALVVVIRRPGCLICRDQAVAIWEARETLTEVCGGGQTGTKASKPPVRLCVVVHEWKEREIKAFESYWHGEIFFDETKAFYRAVHGGELKRGSVLSLLNPFSKAWANVRQAKGAGRVAEQNFEGDGLTLGGLAILDVGGDATYVFQERNLGDRASLTEVSRQLSHLYSVMYHS
jgi:hypothetical protein